MLIDWFTVGAQALNFALLVWLMKRFLYKPVLAAIDAREKRIAEQLAEADAAKAEAVRQCDALRSRNAAFDRQRSELLAHATADAGTERQRLVDAAAKTAEAAATRRREVLDDEADALAHALGLRLRQEVFDVVRQTLADLATVSLEAQVCEVFIARLRTLDGPARDGFAEAIRTSRDGALVRSAFALPPTQQTAIGGALHDVFQTDLALRFETAPDLVAGIELAIDGRTLEWSIARYIDSLGGSVDALTARSAPLHAAREGPPKAKPGPTPAEAPAPEAPRDSHATDGKPLQAVA